MSMLADCCSCLLYGLVVSETVKTLSPAFARMVTTETMDVLTEAEECEEEEHDYETEEEDDNSVPETVLLHPQ